jgi:hypothetical protein
MAPNVTAQNAGKCRGTQLFHEHELYYMFLVNFSSDLSLLVVGKWVNEARKDLKEGKK